MTPVNTSLAVAGAGAAGLDAVVISDVTSVPCRRKVVAAAVGVALGLGACTASVDDAPMAVCCC